MTPTIRANIRRALQLLMLVGAALPCAVQAAAQESGTVRGQVRSEGGAGPFSGAIVEVVGLAGYTALTNSAGEYALRGVPAGRRVLRARHMGHAPLEIEVVIPAGQEIMVDLSLRLEPIVLAPIDVAGARSRTVLDTLGASPAELGMAGARALGSSPGFAELGMADAVQRVPGQEPPDPSNVLYVRGAGADLKLVYLDGAPVYAPFPLGGLVDAFTPGALGSAEVYLGGAPAKYDGGLSYVMDLRTRGIRSDRLRTSGALDLLSARATIESPIVPGLAVLASGRTVHGAGTMDPLPYAYREVLLRADLSLPAGAHLRFTGFVNDESAILEHEDGGSSVDWGNSAGSLRLVTPWAGGDAEVTASFGSYDARLPLGAGDAGRIDGAAGRARLAADFTGAPGGIPLRYGVSLDRLTHTFTARLRDGAAVAADVTGSAAGAYVDASWQPAARMRLRGGLRADHFGFYGKLVFAPRIALTFLATDRAALTVAAGRYHQYVRVPESDALYPESEQAASVVMDPLSVGASSHLAVSLDQEISDGLRLGLEGFFKTFEGVPMGGSDHANSSGVDVWLRRDAGRVTGWAGYSLAWIWSGGGGTAADRFSGRHLLTAGVGTPITERARVEASFSYGSGLPYAAIPLSNPGSTFAADTRQMAAGLEGSTGAPPILPAPDQPYLRLDLSATHSWARRWGGRHVQLASYLKLLNTLGHRDALFYRYDADHDLRALAVIPFVPVLGMEWRF